MVTMSGMLLTDAMPVGPDAIDPGSALSGTSDTAGRRVPGSESPGEKVPAPQFGKEEAAAPPPVVDMEAVPPDLETGQLDGRRRPGFEKGLPNQITQNNLGAVRAPPPQAFPTDQIPVPDRWRIMTSLCPTKGGDQSIFGVFGAMREVCHSKFDPYHQNTLKADRPLQEGKKPRFLKGHDWFFNLGLTSDTIVEPRSFPIPVGVQTTERPGSNDVFGKNTSLVVAQTFIASASLIKGNTAFRPPDIEYRLTLAANFNYVNVPEQRVLLVQPSERSSRFRKFVGVQEAFIDYHLRNVSDRYDFDSVRVGIQPFQADFRGFLFNEEQLGIRFFGNRDNNRFQYNLAAFWRLEKDTNSGLNSVVESPRKDFVFIANVYRQDFLRPGITGQFTVAYNRNREANSPQDRQERLPDPAIAARRSARPQLRCGLSRHQFRWPDGAVQPHRFGLLRAGQ